MSDFYRGKRVLVTGAAGTVGSALFSALHNLGTASVLAFDNNESELFHLTEELKCPTAAVLGDVRDLDTLQSALKGIDIVFHAAALKHVPLCERNPMEAVRTNVLGVQSVIKAAISQKVGRVIYTSSDKAVNPTSVMGTSKLMGEQLINAANLAQNGQGTIFASTRFGNVLGSRGSVVPIFASQIRKGQSLTLTSEEMTRFVMTEDEAVNLLLSAASMARGGDVLITKMKVIKISDLAASLIEVLAPRFGHDPASIGITITGTRPGEKMFEELMNVEEVRRSIELERMFAVLPAVRDLYDEQEYEYDTLKRKTVTRPYNSSNEEHLSQAELTEYLLSSNLLDKYQG